MPDSYDVELRSVTGKGLKQLRRDGTTPANIYGRGLESVAVQLPWARARFLLNAHGRNTLIELKLGAEGKARPVVVRDISRDPVSGAVFHIDFFQVDLTRPIQAAVPIHFIGEAPAVHTFGGVFVQALDVVHVEALPNEMPEAVEVSIESLTELEQSLTVADITLPHGVTMLTAEDQQIAQIARPRLEVEEDETVPEGEEGVVPAEGDEADEASGEESESSEG
ncbi:MAG: 50S ribosomal protein L25 [Chloroflexi bacterium]|nr:50S ribosomal protein L25 [Chloroflexota bacterium]MDA1145727.1 50S ribosomal protein L25 [Chloroflexota bacterium]